LLPASPEVVPPKSATDPRAEAVLSFWFGADPAQPLANSARWFERSDAFDAEVRARFGVLAEAAARGALDGWAATPRGALALAIVLDQFPRNLHRDSAAAFAQDAHARRITEDALARGLDAALTPVQRWFLVMPLMHAEDAAAQARCVALFDALLAATQAPEDRAVHEALAYARAFAVRHREVVARFGRFPHRNPVLGRETTPAEAAWLEAHPGGF
jgi:uncharacterized protein (DUF924 family)